jgi:hypothetical protein
VLRSTVPAFEEPDFEEKENAHDPLADLRTKLEPFDPLDLLATAGALELLPDNAERALRLQAFAQVVASLQIRENLPNISLSRLRQFLSGPELTSLAHGEDPFPNAFVEECPILWRFLRRLSRHSFRRYLYIQDAVEDDIQKRDLIALRWATCVLPYSRCSELKRCHRCTRWAA